MSRTSDRLNREEVRSLIADLKALVAESNYRAKSAREFNSARHRLSLEAGSLRADLEALVAELDYRDKTAPEFDFVRRELVRRLELLVEQAYLVSIRVDDLARVDGGDTADVDSETTRP